MLTGTGVAKFMVGDAFVIPAILLTVLEGSAQSTLWLLMLIPGLTLFAWGMADIVRSRAITRERNSPSGAANPKELTVPATAFAGDLEPKFSGELTPSSVTERTTRELQR